MTLWNPLRPVFPALPDTTKADALPADMPCRQYLAIAECLPALVRRTAQNVWYDSRDPAIAAQDVFPEDDGIHSFYEVESVADLVAIGTYLSKGGDKPFKRATYFCVLPNEVRADFVVHEAPVEGSNCGPIMALHRHVTIRPDQREHLFRRIQIAERFNYRVDRSSMLAMSERLTSEGCHDYSAGPCRLCP